MCQILLNFIVCFCSFIDNVKSMSYFFCLHLLLSHCKYIIKLKESNNSCFTHFLLIFSSIYFQSESFLKKKSRSWSICLLHLWKKSSHCSFRISRNKLKSFIQNFSILLQISFEKNHQRENESTYSHEH